MKRTQQTRVFSLFLAIALLMVFSATFVFDAPVAYAQDQPTATDSSSNTARALLPGAVDPVNFAFAIATLVAVVGIRSLIIKKKNEEEI